MRILFTRFPLESGRGGAEAQTLALMEGLLARGHAVAFLGSCPVLLEECRARGIPSAELKIGRPPVTKWGSISFLWRKRKMRKRLTLALAQFKSLDAICMLSLTEKVLLTSVARSRGIRVLWIEHDRVGRWLRRNPWLGRLRQLARSVDTVVVSELSRAIYLELGWPRTRLIAIPNGVRTKKPGKVESPERPRNREKELHIGCVARLSKDKGVDLLIRAVAGMKNVRLTIIGEGRMQRSVQRQIRKITKREDGAPRITLIARKPDLATFYDALDILVLPSREHDPFGMTVAEAMMRGVAVVVTDACGIAEYLKSGRTAMIAQPNDARALEEAIRRLSDGPTRTRIARAGQRTALKLFALDTMIDAYEEVMQK